MKLTSPESGFKKDKEIDPFICDKIRNLFELQEQGSLLFTDDQKKQLYNYQETHKQEYQQIVQERAFDELTPDEQEQIITNTKYHEFMEKRKNSY